MAVVTSGKLYPENPLLQSSTAEDNRLNIHRSITSAEDPVN